MYLKFSLIHKKMEKTVNENLGLHSISRRPDQINLLNSTLQGNIIPYSRIMFISEFQYFTATTAIIDKLKIYFGTTAAFLYL